MIKRRGAEGKEKIAMGALGDTIDTLLQTMQDDLLAAAKARLAKVNKDERSLLAYLVLKMRVALAEGKLDAAQKTLEEIEEANASLRSDISGMRREITGLESDPFAIEKVAREAYGYMRPGERVYRIITVSPGDKKTPPGASGLDNGRGEP